MILYFSGTGNSEFCAKYLAKKLADQLMSLNGLIKSKVYPLIESNLPIVVVCPIYAWRIPRVVSEWIEKVKFRGNSDIYFVTTCGSESYGAGLYLKKLCNKKKLNYKGIAEVVMPSNYIIMFDSPSENEIEADYNNAPKVLDNIAYYIANDQFFPDIKSCLVSYFMSGFVNDVFYPLFVNDKKFVVSDNCIGCGLCESNCPLGNINIVDGKPVWNGNCTHCMACISKCPVEAIEYGKATEGKTRYTCKI